MYAANKKCKNYFRNISLRDEQYQKVEQPNVISAVTPITQVQREAASEGNASRKHKKRDRPNRRSHSSNRSPRSGWHVVGGALFQNSSPTDLANVVVKYFYKGQLVPMRDIPDDEENSVEKNREEIEVVEMD